MAAFLLFAGVVLLGMTAVAMNIWGPYLIEFKSLRDAFLAVLYFSMGTEIQINHSVGLLDFERLRVYNMIWSFIYMIVYMLVIVYFLSSAFIMIFADSYRRATLHHGSSIHN